METSKKIGRTGLYHYPRLQLAHRVSVERDGDIETTTYVLYPVEVRRPENGCITASIRCGYCDEPVTCTLFSAGILGARRRVAVFLSAVVPVAGVAIMAWPAILHATIPHEEGSFTDLGLVTLFVIFAVLGVAGIVGVIGWLWSSYCPKDGVRPRDGVVLPSSGPDYPLHTLRPPGETVSTYDHGSRD